MLSRSISEISHGLKDGSVLALELCKASLARAESIKSLNCFISLTQDLALQQAEVASKRYKAGNPIGPLDGVPIAVKDSFCTKGIKTTCASHMLANFIPPYNATVVQKLLDAGAVLVGKTNLDEFAMGSGTIDSIYGPTKNIWRSGIKYKLKPDVATTFDSLNSDWFVAGGSSGGSAVAVASGACFAALGSDTGGSTRNPAAYCGVVGLKSSYGVLSRHGLIPLVNSMDVPGIITRTVDDAALIYNTLAGWDITDSTTSRDVIKPVEIPKEISIKDIKIGIPQEYHSPGLESQVVCTWSKVADILEQAGAQVVPVSLPHTQHSIACYSVLNHCEVASNMARYDGIEFGLRPDENRSTEELYASSRKAGFNEVVRGRILSGNYFLLSRNYDLHFMQALKVRRLIAEDFARVWRSGVDILLTPVTLTDAPLHSEFSLKDNREQCATQDYCTQPTNLAGCPAISLPIELSSQGLPISLQLIGPNFSEQKLFEVSKWIELAVNFPKMIFDS